MNITELALTAAEKEMADGETGYVTFSPLELLRERVVSGIEYVPFYRALYEPFGPVPAKDSEFIEWFAKLPIINKTQLQAAGQAALLNTEYNPSELITKPTSGSTGIPFTLLLENTLINFRKWRFLRPYQRVVKEPPARLVFIFPWHFLARTPGEERALADQPRASPRESQESGSSEHIGSAQRTEGVTPRFSSIPKKVKSIKKAAQETDQPIEKSPVLDRPYTVNSWLPVEQLFEVLNELNPAGLIGFASSLAALARWMRQEHRRLPSIQQVWTTSEVLSPEGADMIRTEMGCEPLAIYASNEFGFMAWEAQNGGPMYCESDRLYFENIKRDKPEPAEIGELSRIVVTDLLNDTMPLIRYDIEDIARPSNPIQVTKDVQCAVIEDLQGKQADLLQPPDGRTVTTFQILGAIRDQLPNAQYRFIAVTDHRCILQYRPGVGFSQTNVEIAIRVLNDILGHEIEIVPQEVEAIEREPSGKLRPIVNLCNVSERSRIKLAKHLGVLSLLPPFASRETATLAVEKALIAVLPSRTINGQSDQEQELYADLGIDSLRFVRLILELETELDQEINDEDLLDADLITVGDLVTFVENLVLA